jgi:hypothetical protein
LYHEFRLTLVPGERTEALGPLWSCERQWAPTMGRGKAAASGGPAKTGTTNGQSTFTLAPLFSRSVEPDLDTTSFDFLYPLLTYDRFGGEYRFQFFQLLSLAGSQSQSGLPAERFTLFPLYFQQRSREPGRNYTALLPFYGRLQNRLFRDEVKFVLYPAYVQTRKQDVVTDNYLAPFFHLRHGEGLSGWQFWPLLGREHKEVTTRTNGFGETEIVGGHDKFFALWPLYFRDKLGLGTTNPVSQRALLPLFAQLRSPLRDSATYLFPLGLTLTDDRERRYHEVGAPWPLVVFARGEGKTMNRVWPLFSQAHSATLESDFYLWPLYKSSRIHSAPLARERTRILLFLYSELTERNTETGRALQRTDLWPLFTARRDLGGNERLQLLAPLEPFLPNNGSIERNYSPLWSLWRSEKNARTGAASQSFLWNLYRRETTPQTKKCSLLFGLIQYQSGPEGARWRVFYVPCGSRHKAAQSAAAGPAARGPAFGGRKADSKRDARANVGRADLRFQN